MEESPGLRSQECSTPAGSTSLSMNSGPNSQQSEQPWPCGRKPSRRYPDWGYSGAVRNHGAIIKAGALRRPSGEALLSMEGEGLLGVSRPELLSCWTPRCPPPYAG